MKIHISAAVLVGTLTTLFACATKPDSGEVKAESTPTESRKVDAPTHGPMHAEPFEESLAEADDSPVDVWTAPSFTQAYNLYFNARKLVVIDRRPDPDTGIWESNDYTGFCSFQVADAASARRDRFVVAGWDGPDADEFVLERWDLRVGPQPVQIGGPAPAPTLFPHKAFRKTEIYRGPLGTSLRGLEYDAERRYIMVLIEEANGIVSLYQFGNSAGAAPLLVADSTFVPELANVRHIQKFDHPTFGRLLECYWEMPNTFSVIFTDTNNDTLFDGSPLVGDWATLESIGIKGYGTRDLLKGPGA